MMTAPCSSSVARPQPSKLRPRRPLPRREIFAGIPGSGRIDPQILRRNQKIWPPDRVWGTSSQPHENHTSVSRFIDQCPHPAPRGGRQRERAGVLSVPGNHLDRAVGETDRSRRPGRGSRRGPGSPKHRRGSRPCLVAAAVVADLYRDRLPRSDAHVPPLRALLLHPPESSRCRMPARSSLPAVHPEMVMSARTGAGATVIVLAPDRRRR